jgi:hypothetical protein
MIPVQYALEYSKGQVSQDTSTLIVSPTFTVYVPLDVIPAFAITLPLTYKYICPEAPPVSLKLHANVAVRPKQSLHDECVLITTLLLAEPAVILLTQISPVILTTDAVIAVSLRKEYVV